MNRIITGIFLITAATAFAIGQGRSSSDFGIDIVELYAPWEWTEQKAKFNQSLYFKSCFNLLRLERRCDGTEFISYGNRFGDNWDIFSVGGAKDSQTRMIDLGRHEWNDQIDVPWITPWAKLKPGEQRHITVNTSGADGRDGAPGMNADGTYTLGSATEKGRPPRSDGFADKPITKQVSTAVKTDSGALRTDNYTPFMEVKPGHIYAVHIVDPVNDHYLLIRVEDLIRGTKVAISFKRIDAPQKPVL